jgi:hypothetical protein
MIHQNAADHLRRDPEEMRAPLPLNIMLIHQSKKRFVDKGGALQRVSVALAFQIGVGKVAQLVIYER